MEDRVHHDSDDTVVLKVLLDALSFTYQALTIKAAFEQTPFRPILVQSPSLGLGINAQTVGYTAGGVDPLSTEYISSIL